MPPPTHRQSPVPRKDPQKAMPACPFWHCHFAVLSLPSTRSPFSRTSNLAASFASSTLARSLHAFLTKPSCCKRAKPENGYSLANYSTWERLRKAERHFLKFCFSLTWCFTVADLGIDRLSPQKTIPKSNILPITTLFLVLGHKKAGQEHPKPACATYFADEEAPLTHAPPQPFYGRTRPPQGQQPRLQQPRSSR